MGARHGQHFLRNRGAIETILRRFDAGPEDRVVEIGPGRGALTSHLAQRAGALAAVEIDPELAAHLAGALGIPIVPGSALNEISGGAKGSFDEHETSAEPASRSALPDGRGDLGRSSSGRGGGSGAPGRAVSDGRDGAPGGRDVRPGGRGSSCLFILEADALQVRYADLAHLLGVSAEMQLRVIGSLPYSVATALVRRMIAERHLIADALLMVQSEVADRLLAVPRTKAYGYLSVLVALTAERERVLTLQPGSFSPPPKVRSTVVHLRFARPGPGFEFADARLEALLKAAFSERRKKLAGNLAKKFGIDREEAEARLSACGVDPGSRAEELSPEAFVRLASALPSLPGVLPF